MNEWPDHQDAFSKDRFDSTRLLALAHADGCLCDFPDFHCDTSSFVQFR